MPISAGENIDPYAGAAGLLRAEREVHAIHLTATLGVSALLYNSLPNVAKATAAASILWQYFAGKPILDSKKGAAILAFSAAAGYWRDRTDVSDDRGERGKPKSETGLEQSHVQAPARPHTNFAG